MLTIATFVEYSWTVFCKSLSLSCWRDSLCDSPSLSCKAKSPSERSSQTAKHERVQDVWTGPGLLQECVLTLQNQLLMVKCLS